MINNAMSYKDIKSKIKSNDDYYIINVTRPYYFFVNVENITNVRGPELSKETFLITNPEEIMEKLNNVVNNYKDKLVFIIFNEYFFNENYILKESECTNIITKFNDLSQKFPNLFIFFNLLHYIKVENNKKMQLIKDMSDYKSIVYNHITTFHWSIVKSQFGLNYNESFPWYCNNTFVSFRGKIILKRKKSSYCEEIMESNTNNYLFGYGYNEKGDNLTTDEEKFYNLINNYFIIDICYDYQARIRTYKYLLLNKLEVIPFDDENKKRAKNIQKLFKENKQEIDKKKIKIYILISNTTNINSFLYDLPPDIICVYCDTQVNSVFYIKNDDYLNSIINSHNLVFDDDKVNNRCKEDFLCLKEFIKNDFGNSIKSFFVPKLEDLGSISKKFCLK